MTKPSSRNREKFRDLLRDLFQFDCADLDFGIYRILNQKRDEIEKFLEEDLLNSVEDALSSIIEADASDVREQVEEKKEKLIETLSEDALDALGNVKEQYRDTPVAKEYKEAQSRQQNIEVADETEARIFDDLYRFFKRYYDRGDFLSKRRFSTGDSKYVVPYDGEEVHLHWANKDQYYIKTTEHFTDYRAEDGDYTIEFVLENAHTPKNNVKGDSRYFVLSSDEPINFEEDTNKLSIKFDHRPLTDEEQDQYLSVYNQNNSSRKTVDQGVICESLNTIILNDLEDSSLKAWLTRDTEGTGTGYLLKHLKRYTTRNTSDYFIHKDLEGFLNRELDFYIKNEILELDEMLGHTTGMESSPAVIRAKVVRQIAEDIITFLAQIENFQKRLFEKKKFIYQTDYCITLDKIPEEYYQRILNNEEQIEKWRDLYAIDDWDQNMFWNGEFDEKFLSNNQNLMVDTSFFSEKFKDRILERFENLNEEIDGLLFHGENYQCLELLRNTYRNRIKCIHIDPPFNTQSTEFFYKNGYRHSSWLTMMNDRIRAAVPLLNNEGVYFCHIDDNEYENLCTLFKQLNTINQGTIVWDKRTPAPGSNTIARQHEYLIAHSKGDIKLRYRKGNAKKLLEKAEEFIQKHGGVNEKSRTAFKDWVKDQDDLSGGLEPYCEIDQNGRVYREVHLGASEQRTDEKYFEPLIHPETGKPCPVPERGWTGAPEFMKNLLENDKIVFGEDESKQPTRKYFLDENLHGELTSVIQSAEKGKKDLDAMNLEFPYCHPVSFYKEVNWSGMPDGKGVLLDFFAGSGTTGHATINLNREDDGDRKYILAEMGEYFDTVLRPRLQKAVFSDSWKNGVPQNQNGVSQLIKYHRVESYDDTLNNIEINETEQSQQKLLHREDKFKDYMLSYMLDFETSDSPSLLTKEAFEKPFNYTLKIQHGFESPEDTKVDLVETFHYLIGMQVKSIGTHEHQDRTYRSSQGTIEGNGETEEVLVIWRNTEEPYDLELDREREWLQSKIIQDQFDRVYINGSFHVPEAEPIEFTFREKMEGETT